MSSFCVLAAAMIVEWNRLAEGCKRGMKGCGTLKTFEAMNLDVNAVVLMDVFIPSVAFTRLYLT